MVSFFKDKSTASVFGIVFFSIVTRSTFLVGVPAVYSFPKEGFVHYLLNLVNDLSGILQIVLFHAIIIVQALRLNYALNDSRMMPRPTFTTALAYILITAIVPQWNSFNGALVVNSLLIWILFLIIKLSLSQQPLGLIYNIGFISGLTAILYYPAIPVIIAVYFGLAFLKSFQFNEWIILFLGIITPVYLLAGSLFLTGNFDLLTENLPEIVLHGINPIQLVMTIVSFSFAAIPILLGIIYWQKSSSKMVIHVRSEWKFVLTLLIVLLPASVLLPDIWPLAMMLTCIPAAAFISNAFFYPKASIIPAVLFWGFMALIIYNNWVIAKI